MSRNVFENPGYRSTFGDSIQNDRLSTHEDFLDDQSKLQVGHGLRSIGDEVVQEFIDEEDESPLPLLRKRQSSDGINIEEEPEKKF